MAIGGGDHVRLPDLPPCLPVVPGKRRGPREGHAQIAHLPGHLILLGPGQAARLILLGHAALVQTGQVVGPCGRTRGRFDGGRGRCRGRGRGSGGRRGRAGSRRPDAVRTRCRCCCRGRGG
ncbi:hypothetical protein E4L95_23750, partial [Paracoccus liaowanqingii]